MPRWEKAVLLFQFGHLKSQCLSWIWMRRQLYAIPGLSAETTTLAKASSWSGPQDQMCLVLRSSLRGLECEAICGQYLPNWLIKSVGSGDQFWDGNCFQGIWWGICGDAILIDDMSYRNVTWPSWTCTSQDCGSLQLSGFTPAFSHLSHSFLFFPKIRMSSMRQRIPLNPLSMALIRFESVEMSMLIECATTRCWHL